MVAMLKLLSLNSAKERKEEARNQKWLREEMKKGNPLANPYVLKFKEKMMAIVLKKVEFIIQKYFFQAIFCCIIETFKRIHRKEFKCQIRKDTFHN